MSDLVEIIATNRYLQAITILITMIAGVQYGIKISKFAWSFIYTTFVSGISIAIRQILERRKLAYILAAKDIHILFLGTIYKIMNAALLFLLAWIISKVFIDFTPPGGLLKISLILLEFLLIFGFILRIGDLWYYIIAVKRVRTQMNTASEEQL